MPNVSDRGILIAIEGIDGAGKTTQVRKLEKLLRRAGQSVISSKEPTTGQWGSILRQSAFSGRLSLEEELATFIKDRTEHVENKIKPHLDLGHVVILDRYFYSTIAYQGARGADITSVSKEMFDRFPLPDAVFILDVDPVIGIHRIAHDRGEEPNHFEDRAGLGQARKIFQSMEGWTNVHIVDATLEIRPLHDKILEVFMNGPLKAKRCSKSYGCDDQVHCSFRLSGSCEWWNTIQSMGQPGVPVQVAE